MGTLEAKQEEEKRQEEQDQEARQNRLNDLLGAFRDQLFPYRDQIQPMFADFDQNGDGHCEIDQFRALLEHMGVEVDEQDMELCLSRSMTLTILTKLAQCRLQCLMRHCLAKLCSG